MKRDMTGRYVTVSTTGGERCRAFLPEPLPRVMSLKMDPDLQDLYEQALVAIGKLEGLSTLLPDPEIFIYSYVRKEALLSSQIEGTQSSLDELLMYESKEAPGVPLEDVREVANYVQAMDWGMKRLKENFPLSLRLIREIHDRLLSTGRGSNRERGRFRRSQNWIAGDRPGNAVFVPPPHEHVQTLMGDLEKFLHDQPQRTPTLLKAALAHVQFETIHPFLDGNGRLGRLLIAFILYKEGVLSEPLLYISLYFKTHRKEYYDLLQTVRMRGDWEAWLRFFLQGVKETSEQAVQTARRLTSLFQNDRVKIQSLGKAASSALRVHYELQKKPIITIPVVEGLTGLSTPTVSASMQRLINLGLVEEIKTSQTRRFFSYDPYLKILREGTEPIR